MSKTRGDLVYSNWALRGNESADDLRVIVGHAANDIAFNLEYQGLKLSDGVLKICAQPPQGLAAHGSMLATWEPNE